MISKDQYLAALEHEFKTIRHLASKIKPEYLSYRPTPGQRSLLELLQYMGFIFGATVRAVINGDLSGFGSASEAAKNLSLADFDQAMEEQGAEIRELVTPLTEEQLEESVKLWFEQPRAMHLLNGPIKWSAAYKMQLFLYLKSCGLSELSTSNLWAGMDAQPRAEA